MCIRNIGIADRRHHICNAEQILSRPSQLQVIISVSSCMLRMLYSRDLCSVLPYQGTSIVRDRMSYTFVNVSICRIILLTAMGAVIP